MKEYNGTCRIYITLFKDYVQSHNKYVDADQRMSEDDTMIHFHSALDTASELEITTSNLEKDELNGIVYPSTSAETVCEYERAKARVHYFQV